MNDHPAAASGAKREKLHVLPYDLVPFQEMTEAYVRVAEFGAKKYEPWNWSKGLSRVQILGSLLRHTFAYLRGEETDKDSGLSHTDHILWNAVALAHNVHWNLEDGRRVEPLRGYKLPADDENRPMMDIVREIVAADDARIDDRAALQAYIKTAADKMRFTKEKLVDLCKEFGICQIKDLKDDQVRPFFHAVQAAERHDQ